MGDQSALTLNLGRVRDEVTRCFHAYDSALLANDIDGVGGWFFDGPEAVRFGLREELYGAPQIAAWRQAAPPLRRSPLRRYDVTSVGTDIAVVTAEFDEAAATGRQTQAWIRSLTGWRVLSAHVSVRPGAGAWRA